MDIGDTCLGEGGLFKDQLSPAKAKVGAEVGKNDEAISFREEQSFQSKSLIKQI